MLCTCSSGLSFVAPVTRQISSRGFSISPVVGAFFRQKKEQTHQQVQEDIKSEVMRSGYLGQYEKNALQSMIDRSLGKIPKAYNPPDDFKVRFETIFADVFGPAKKKAAMATVFPDRLVKFQFLTACEIAFAHSVPNPFLHEMTTVKHVFEFYQTPVSGHNGLTRFQQTELPPNMHVSYDPIRFDPENDPYYGGITAFPGHRNVVSGLKAKKLYKGHDVQHDWPKVLDVYRIPRYSYKKPYPHYDVME